MRRGILPRFSRPSANGRLASLKAIISQFWEPTSGPKLPPSKNEAAVVKSAVRLDIKASRTKPHEPGSIFELASLKIERDQKAGKTIERSKSKSG